MQINTWFIAERVYEKAKVQRQGLLLFIVGAALIAAALCLDFRKTSVSEIILVLGGALAGQGVMRIHHARKIDAVFHG